MAILEGVYARHLRAPLVKANNGRIYIEDCVLVEHFVAPAATITITTVDTLKRNATTPVIEIEAPQIKKKRQGRKPKGVVDPPPNVPEPKPLTALEALLAGLSPETSQSNNTAPGPSVPEPKPLTALEALLAGLPQEGINDVPPSA